MLEGSALIRSVKTKAIVRLEKGFFNLIDDAGEKIAINKDEIAEKLITVEGVVEDKHEVEDETVKNEAVQENGTVEEAGEVDEKVVKEIVKKRIEVKKPAKEKKVVKKKPEPKKKEMVKKETPKPTKKTKKEKPKKEVKKRETKKIEMTPSLEKILKREGSKSSKMADLFKATGSIMTTSKLLKTHYSYVYNMLVWNPKNKK
jgi:outer membrane biosynthesis protein TonB